MEDVKRVELKDIVCLEIAVVHYCGCKDVVYVDSYSRRIIGTSHTESCEDKHVFIKKDLMTLHAAEDKLSERFRLRRLVDTVSPEDVGSVLEDYVNNMCHEPEELVTRLCQVHRTLQQRIMVLFIKFVRRMAKNNTDARNDASVAMARALLNKLDAQTNGTFDLPHI